MHYNKPQIKHDTKIGEIIQWLSEAKLTYMDFLTQLEHRKRRINAVDMIIRKSML